MGVLAIAVWTSVTVSCHKDADHLGLVGNWVFSGDVNCIFTLNGVKHDAKKEGIMDLTDFSEFRGVFLQFEEDGTVIIGMDEESTVSATYVVSGNKLTVRAMDSSVPMRYRISGEKLELLWDEATIAAMEIEEFPLMGLGIDDYEIVLGFFRGE